MDLTSNPFSSKIYEHFSHHEKYQDDLRSYTRYQSSHARSDTVKERVFATKATAERRRAPRVRVLYAEPRTLRVDARVRFNWILNQIRAGHATRAPRGLPTQYMSEKKLLLQADIIDKLEHSSQNYPEFRAVMLSVTANPQGLSGEPTRWFDSGTSRNPAAVDLLFLVGSLSWSALRVDKRFDA